MDVRPSSEQRALRDAVARAVARLGPAGVGQLDDRERAAKLDAAVRAAGWRELRARNDDGGPWASGVEVAIVAEELARGVADTAFLGPTLAADLRRAARLPPADVPETIVLSTDLAAPGHAGREGVALDCAGATAALVLVPHGEGFSLGRVHVPVDAVGVDLTRATAVVPAAHAVPLGEPGAVTREDLTRWTALGLALASADLLGAMGGAIQAAVRHVSEREQFGRPVGSFQAVQHLMADAVVQLEGSRSIVAHAAWAVDALAPEQALCAAAGAKAYASRAAREVCETAVQVHGGMGNTWDCPVNLYLRRALLSIDVLGGVGPNLQRVLRGNGIGQRDGLL